MASQNLNLNPQPYYYDYILVLLVLLSVLILLLVIVLLVLLLLVELLVLLVLLVLYLAHTFDFFCESLPAQVSIFFVSSPEPGPVVPRPEKAPKHYPLSIGLRVKGLIPSIRTILPSY